MSIFLIKKLFYLKDVLEVSLWVKLQNLQLQCKFQHNLSLYSKSFRCLKILQQKKNNFLKFQKIIILEFSAFPLGNRWAKVRPEHILRR